MNAKCDTPGNGGCRGRGDRGRSLVFQSRTHRTNRRYCDRSTDRTASTARSCRHRVAAAAFTKVSSLGVEEQCVNIIADFSESADGNSTLGDGYRVEARITIDELPHTLLIPNSALFRHQREWHVLKIMDDKAALRRVAIGLQNESHSQVTQGLSQGDKVIVYPSGDLSPGTRVRLVSDGAVVTPPARPSE
jgi:hypothetical protein